MGKGASCWRLRHSDKISCSIRGAKLPLCARKWFIILSMKTFSMRIYTYGSYRCWLNSNQLKLIAIIAMTADHLTWVIWPGYQTGWPQLALHCLGRITAPIMWFFIAEGYHYTHSFKKYALRLLLFAVISHFAYTFAFGIPFIPFTTTAFNQTSVIWSLFWGLMLLKMNDSDKFKGWQKAVIVVLVCLISFCSDWSCIDRSDTLHRRSSGQL